MHENIGALKQNTVSIKNNSLSGYSRHPVLQFHCITRRVHKVFIFSWIYIRDISPLQNFLLRPQIFLYPSLSPFLFSQSLSRSPSILHLARTSAPFATRLIFPEKPLGLAPSAWPLFSHGVYLSAIRLFSPSSQDIVPDHPNIYEMRVAASRRPSSSSLRTLPRSIHIKGTYSRVSSTLFNVYISRRG